MDKKLILFDVDGTLVSYKSGNSIPKETVEAIRRLRQNGHIIALATGRSREFSESIMRTLQIDCAILHNGALIILNGKGVYENKISKPVSAKICGELQKTPLCVFAFDGEKIYVNNASSESLAFMVNEGQGKDSIRPLSENKNSLLSISVYGDIKEITDFLKTVPSVDFMPDQYQITAKGVSKGTAMLGLSKLVGVPKENIVAVGDGKNDVDMIRGAAVGIAVGGACKELKAAADVVCGDIESGGILKAFKSLGLI